MSTTYGTLLETYSYSTGGFAICEAARLEFQNAQIATASLLRNAPLIACVGDMVPPDTSTNRDQLEGDAISGRFKDVSDLVIASHCTYFLNVGDGEQGVGELVELQHGYAQTYGRLMGRTLPTPGNHEYMQEGADAYYEYFGARAGVPGRGYYGVNVANWRIYSLNTNSASYVEPASDQMRWLAADLAAHADKPKMVAFHHPRWTDGGTSVTDDANMDYLWQVLTADGTVQMTLSGHDHSYQRWDRIKTTTPPGNTSGEDGNGDSYPPVFDADIGITQFVVGTGGYGFFNLIPPRPGATEENLNGGPGDTGRSTYGIDRQFGVLFIRLGPSTWDYEFNSINGTTYDTGTMTIRMPA